MDSTTLRARINPHWIEQRKVDRECIKERERLWEQGLTRIQYQDDLDERHLAQGQSVRSSHNAQRRGVERLFRLMSDVDIAVFPPPNKEDLEEEMGEPLGKVLYDLTWAPLIAIHFNKLIPETQKREPRVAQNRKDVKENFLYNEWKRQMNRSNGFQTYAVYALFTALKAAFILMVSKPGGRELIQTFYHGELPDRETLVEISEKLNVTVTTDTEFMSMMLAVPHMLEMAEALILHYSDVVRAERVDKNDGDVLSSPLPDDPLEETLPERYEIPEETRFENGYQAYLAKEGSAKVIAKKYNLPRDRFFDYLRGKGVEMRHGGDRKAHA